MGKVFKIMGFLMEKCYWRNSFCKIPGISHNIYIDPLIFDNMAATPPKAKKRRMEYNIDQDVYDNFVKACSRKGLAPQVLIEQFMKNYNQACRV